MTDQEAAQLREQNAALQRQNEELRQAAHARAVDAIRQDNVAFAESLAAQARIPAAMKDQVAAIGAQLQSTPDVEFGEGDAAKPMHQVFRELLQALPPAVEFGETATRQRAADGAADGADAATGDGPAFAEADPDRLAQHTAALAYAKKHGVPYAQAAAAVVK